MLGADWRGRRPGPWLASAATGIALNFVQGVDPWWPMAWLAPIPLLWALLSTPSLREALTLVLFAGLLGTGSVAVYYLQATTGAPGE